MNLRDWEIIHALYERKNITRAARTLFISQPALTARVKQIEEYFGCQIILRERRGIQFTPEGEYLAKQAVNVLKQQEQIRSDVLSMKDNLGGTLKLGASNFFSKYKLPKILGDFRKIYPNVEFQVLSGWSEDIYRKMADRDVHVGFIRGDYPWRGRRDVLFEETLCVASTEPFEWMICIK
ncbi:LysR family transcriptional regulator [Geomicrobium sp. JCM 19039]|uniref:LysR family transcriptional regulator n=1 Tax=Geomicrobium sp. JCM 19039 TaxID=1460636 RepID=UPI000693CF84|nr:LysR family transcriptional regulator [Geomicrobium sp. JCM 19039]